ncbi:MAG: hypothetical protein VX704_03415 [Verrucomicrobiota bacterium]|nr:hypothetical protein [Verrucomicrobiota bacterium]
MLLLLLELRDELDPLDLNVLPLLGRLGLEACDELDPLNLNVLPLFGGLGLEACDELEPRSFNVLLAGFFLLELPESDRL